MGILTLMLSSSGSYGCPETRDLIQAFQMLAPNFYERLFTTDSERPTIEKKARRRRLQLGHRLGKRHPAPVHDLS